ncbi:MAG: hypothetical protein H0W76_23445 [Pyrinomonadaceae bacterium]|nr:hypothetical protein [Pyrinomonadaceae bacterium]
MAAKAKNSNGNGGNGNSPALHFEYIEWRESETYEMDGRVLHQLEEYPAYVEAVTGRKPTKSQVVEAALAQTFTADAGFQKHLRSTIKPSGASAKAEAQATRTNPANNHQTSKHSNAEIAGQAGV